MIILNLTCTFIFDLDVFYKQKTIGDIKKMLNTLLLAKNLSMYCSELRSYVVKLYTIWG